MGRVKETAGRPASQELMLARLSGDKTYLGTVHSRCGTNERYVSGGGCVHCARSVATEQREARRALLADQQIATTDEINHGETDVEEELDIDPRTEYEKSIDELL